MSDEGSEVPLVVEPGSSFRETSWTWRQLLVGFAPVLAGMTCRFWMSRPLYAMLWFPLAVLVFAWMIAYPLAMLRRQGVSLPLPRLRAIPVEVSVAIMMTLIVALLQIAAMVTLTLAFGLSVEKDFNPFPLGESPSQFVLIAFAVLSFTLAPLGEELMFRGLLYNALRRRMPVVAAIVVQGLMFGLLHPWSWLQNGFIAGTGIVLGAVYEWRKTLLTPILLHASVNAVAMVPILVNLATLAYSPQIGLAVEPRNGQSVVTSVLPGGAAEEAGLRVGDELIAVDGTAIADGAALIRVVRLRQIGDVIPIQYLRDGKSWEVDVTLKARQ